jgi:N-acetylneuraminic acid mutarotase
MTNPTVTAPGSWQSPKSSLPTAAGWDGRHDGPVLLHDATNGDRILAAGGSDGTATGSLDAVALYDATQKAWTAKAKLGTGRRGHAVTALSPQQVLVTGGIPAGTGYPAAGLPTAEIFDVDNNTWTATTATMTTARWGHSAVLLKDGTVLVAGGSTSRSGTSLKALATAELYNPAAKTWTATGDPMTDPRSGHAAVVLPNGKVLVIGGSVPIRRDQDAALAYCELYDPEHRTWTPAATLNEPRSLHQATLLSGGTHVLVTGGSAPLAGANGTYDPFTRQTAELYDIAKDSWTPLPPMPAGRSHHRAVAVGSNQALIVGGTGSARADIGYESAVLFTKDQANPWTPLAALPVGRWGFGAVTLTGGAHVVVTGGVVRAGPAAAAPDKAELTQDTEVFS